MNLLYFASTRQSIGRAHEKVDIPLNVKTVADLVGWLRLRGAEYEKAFADLQRLRVAVNQVHADYSSVISNGDEIAFFPPVTGG